MEEKRNWTFNTIADIINASNKIAVGDTVETLGYYKINDGGQTIYYISDEDNGKYGNLMLDDNKYAIQVYKELNVKCFGAYGDGIHDDTTVIQNVFNLAKQNRLSDFYCGIHIIVFPAGKYLISNTLLMSPFCKIKTIGQAYLIGNDINGAVLAIKPTYEEKPTEMKKLNYQIGSLIDGDIGGFIILNKNSLFPNSIGLELGATNDTQISIANTSISNVSISDFDTNLLLNNYNLYLINFSHCHFETSNCNIKIGKEYQMPHNSGENISFNNCNISSSKIGVQYNTAAFETMFVNCSFDFLYCCFNTFGGNLTQISNSKGSSNYARIFCTNCHFEALGYEEFQHIIINERDPYGMIYNYNDKTLYNEEFVETQTYTTLNLVNCIYYMSTIDKQLFNTTPYDNLNISLSNFTIRDNIGNTNANLMFLGGDNRINVENYKFNIQNTQPLLTKKHNITSFPEFENLEDGVTISNTEKTVTDSFIFSNFKNITSTSKITKENTYSENGKSLSIQASQEVPAGVSENSPELNIDDNVFYLVKPTNIIYSTVLFRNKLYDAKYKLDIDFTIEFYDINQKEISVQNIKKYSLSDGLHYGCSYSAFLTKDIPDNARYFKIKRNLIVSGINGGLVKYHTFYITGLYTFVY